MIDYHLSNYLNGLVVLRWCHQGLQYLLLLGISSLDIY